MQTRKTGIITSAYVGENIEEGYARMKAHGYDYGEYQNFIDTDTAFFQCGDEEFERRVKAEYQAASSAGIVLYSVHAPWRYPPKDGTPEDRAERLDKMLRSLEASAWLHCRCFVIHPLMPFGPDQDPEPQRLWEYNFEFFSRLLPEAKKHGVLLCLENMPMKALSLSRPVDIMRFADLFGGELKLCLDTGHCAVFGESPAAAVRLFGDRLAALHIHDNDGFLDRHWTPYRGVIDWEDFRMAMHAADPAIPMMLETSADHVPASIRDYHERALAETARYLANG